VRAVPRCQRAQVAEHRLVVYRHSILLLETIDNRTFEKRSVEIPLDYSGVVGVLARCNHHRMALLTALEQVRAQLRTYANNVTLLASRHEVARFNAIVVRATAACPIQTNFLRQTLFQHRSTISPELSPCLCSEL